MRNKTNMNLALLTAIMAAGLPMTHFDLSSSPNVSDEDKMFLKTLKGASRDIWHRRLYRGFTPKEREFFETMKKENGFKNV